MGTISTVKLTLTEIGPEKFRSRIDQSPLGASGGLGHDFELPAAEFGEFLSKWPLAGGESQIDLPDFGKRLYDKAIGSEVKMKLEGCLSAARTNDQKIRLAVNLLSPKLYDYPWELLHDGDGFLFESATRIIRVIDEFPDLTRRFGPLRRILIVIASPKGQDTIDQKELAKALKNALTSIPGVESEILTHCSVATLLDRLRDTADRPFDALFVTAHGEQKKDNAVIVLEKRNGQSDELPANKLGIALAKDHPGCFVFLNSCSTAAVTKGHTFSGAAQRLMRDGRTRAVVAMQRPIKIDAARELAFEFFRDLARGNMPEDAFDSALSRLSDQQGWSFPSLYSTVTAADFEERNRMACFLRADPETARFDLYLPHFLLGLLPDDYKRLADKDELPMAPDCYNYKGPTYARVDLDAAKCIVDLASRLVATEKIMIRSAEELEHGSGDSTTHIVLFGSKSHQRVKSALQTYSARFRLEYESKWVIKDKTSDKEYAITDPAKHKPGTKEQEYAQQTDYGLIERFEAPMGRVYIIIAGLGGRATRACGLYLQKNWESLLRDFGSGRFQVLLEVPPGLEEAKVVLREPSLGAIERMGTTRGEAPPKSEEASTDEPPPNQKDMKPEDAKPKKVKLKKAKPRAKPEKPKPARKSDTKSKKKSPQPRHQAKSR